VSFGSSGESNEEKNSPHSGWYLSHQLTDEEETENKIETLQGKKWW